MITATIEFSGDKCQNNDQKPIATDDTVVKEMIISRNSGINRSNAYNDIFLDSPDIEHFIHKGNLNDTISQAIRDFYNVRNFEYAWFSSTGLIEQAFSFHSLYSSERDTVLLNKYLDNRLDILRTGRQIPVDEKDQKAIKTELDITKRFIQYGLENYSSMGIRAAGLGTYIPARRRSIIEFADFVLASNTINNNYALLKKMVGN